jgi:uncharacterized protein (DUF1499 family)
MKIVLYVIAGVVLLLAALVAWVRLSPVDPARWNVDLTAPGLSIGDNWVGFCPALQDRAAAPVAVPADPLAALDRIARATPRTARLAGSPEAGRITWITRSRLFGFPDYTTAQTVAGSAPPRLLCVVARQGIGREDFGVNRARLGEWMRQLLDLEKAPALQGADTLRAALGRG